VIVGVCSNEGWRQKSGANSGHAGQAFWWCEMKLWKKFFFGAMGMGRERTTKESGRDIVIEIEDIKLIVDSSEAGGLAYGERKAFEERESSLYEGIQSVISPGVVIDVGANYGFTGLVFAKRFPRAEIVLVEASPILIPYIEKSFRENKMKGYRVINAVCGASDRGVTEFSLNPRSSQDNRVYGERGWSRVVVGRVSLDSLLSFFPGVPCFLKIDTQGFETQVFEGGLKWLTEKDNWIVKVEFAPYWLRSQGNDAKDLLARLIDLFLVTECPERPRFGRDLVVALFRDPLTAGEVDGFVGHVEALDRNGRGWVDLLVAPRRAKWLEK